MGRAAITGVALAALAAGLLTLGTAPPSAPSPALVVWAWERPERLGFLDPAEVGVAALAGTLTLAGRQAISRPRLQPLEIPQAVELTAVVRIESSRESPPSLDAAQRSAAVEAILSLARLSAGDDREAHGGLQIDFDAASSERAFYRDLLVELRRRWPAGQRLGITAIASWCLGDAWLEGLPVDEVVPMAFRMGLDGPAIRRHLESGGDFRSPLCRQSLGLATDEMLARRPRGRRVYLFHPSPWTSFALAGARAGLMESP